MAATTLAEQGSLEDGLAACEAMTDGDPWRDECFFLIADRTSAYGEQAKTICARAGRYVDRCLGHAFGREGREVLTQLSYGEELTAYRALRERSQDYFTDQRTGAKKLYHLMVEFVASRDIDQPFSAATCGELPEGICQAGFLTRLRFSIRDARGSEHTLHELCRHRPITAEAAAAAGLPTWTEDASPTAQAAWGQLCGGPQPR